MLGLKSDNFDNFDSAKLTNALNERFSPEIRWEAHTCVERGFKIGILHFAEAKPKPVVCTRQCSGLQQGMIYYRYRGRSEAIRYPELRKLLDDEKARERNLWMKQLRRISDAGVDQVAILDLHSGEVSGALGKFYISEDLLPKLQFVREGQFVESEGAPALRLIGNLQSAEGLFIQSTVEVPTPIREFQVVEAFLLKQSVLSPTEYLKAICFEQSYFLPIYYFIQQTNETIGDIIGLLQTLEVRGSVRDKLIKRLEMPAENLVMGSPGSQSVAGMERSAILEKLRTKSLQPVTISISSMRFFEAITHTNAVDFDQSYIYSLLTEHVLTNLSRLNGLHRTAFRKALCHLDLTWYKAATS